MKKTNYMKVKLVKEKEFEYERIESVSDVARLLGGIGLGEAAEEYFYMLCMNSKGDIVGIHEVAHGDLNSCLVNPREVYKRALLNNACSIVVAHNHPSGSTEPSREDEALTKRLQEAGRLLGIKFMDHVIVAGNDHYSFAEEGALGW